MIDRGKIERQLDPGMDNGLQLDVAVVGAGVGGLYTGYRLVTGEPTSGARRELATYCQCF